MTLQTERSLIEGHLQTGMVGTKIQFEDIKVEPDAGETWLQADIINGQEVQKSVGTPGSNVIRGAGVLAVRVNVPSGSGSAPFRIVGDQVMDLFRNVTLDNIRFLPPYVSGGRRAVGDYSVWTIMCPYTRDEFNG